MNNIFSYCTSNKKNLSSEASNRPLPWSECKNAIRMGILVVRLTKIIEARWEMIDLMNSTARRADPYNLSDLQYTYIGTEYDSRLGCAALQLICIHCVRSVQKKELFRAVPMGNMRYFLNTLIIFHCVFPKMYIWSTEWPAKEYCDSY